MQRAQVEKTSERLLKAKAYLARLDEQKAAAEKKLSETSVDGRQGPIPLHQRMSYWPDIKASSMQSSIPTACM